MKFNPQTLAEYREKKVGSLDDLRDKLRELGFRKTTTTLNNYERGIHPPDAEILAAYSEIFGVPVEAFYSRL